MYEIQTPFGSFWRRHVDQFRETSKKDNFKETHVLVYTKNTTEMNSQVTDQCENQTEQQSSSLNNHDDSTEPPQTTQLEKENKRKEIVDGERHQERI